MGLKKLFDDVAVLLSVPVIYLNVFAGIIAFVWLIILGMRKILHHLVKMERVVLMFGWIEFIDY